MSARDEETGEGMTDEQLRVEVTTFLLAGQETTSLALTWTWYLLSQHPARSSGSRRRSTACSTDVRPSIPDLANLPYTRMVIDEAMRLYPPAWGFSRQALADDTLGGFHLPRGWLAFVIPTSCIGCRRSGRIRRRSIPSASRRSAAPIVRSSSTCRSAPGPRQCIGNQFALIEAQLSVATLAQRYRLQLVPGHRVEPWPLITLRPPARPAHGDGKRGAGAPARGRERIFTHGRSGCRRPG